MENFRYCRKCLLRDLDETEYFRSLHEYIENLDDEIKVPENIYEDRLAQCKNCDQLISGMCRICGCYVELRAVMKKNGCPMVHPRWQQALQQSTVLLSEGSGNVPFTD